MSFDVVLQRVSSQLYELEKAQNIDHLALIARLEEVTRQFRETLKSSHASEAQIVEVQQLLNRITKLGDDLCQITPIREVIEKMKSNGV